MHNNTTTFVSGNFTATVTANVGPNAIAAIYSDTPSGYAGVSATSNTVNGAYGAADGNIRTAPVNYSPGLVVLRLVRSGDELIGSYSASGLLFIEAMDLTGKNILGWSSFDLTLYGYTGQSTPGGVTFSNFNIDAAAVKDVTGLQGGTTAAPVALASGETGSVAGDIGVNGSKMDYYTFNWKGDQFDAFSSVLHATDSQYYNFELCQGVSCTSNILDDVLLNSSNGWRNSISSLLAQGQYTIGLTQDGGDQDPQFSIVFGAPISGVPEPATWTMLVMGLGMVGSALRRRHGKANPITV